jgi:hypothetical protein
MESGRASYLLAFVVLLGCSGGDETESSSNTATTLTSGTGGCTPGTEACECIEGGQCVSGLVCASNVCVDIGGTGGADETGMKPGTSGVDDTTTGPPSGSCEGSCGEYVIDGDCFCIPSCEFSGSCCADYETACPGECVVNNQCADDEVCSASSQTCVPAYGHGYEVRVDRWEDHTPDCWDALDCEADVYFRAFHGNQGEIYESSTKTDVVVASWSSEPFELSIDSSKVFQVVFYDFDTTSDDDVMHGVCFPDGQGVCQAIDVEYLHEGGAIWDGRDFYVEVTFAPR